MTSTPVSKLYAICKQICELECKGFWRLCITLRITGFHLEFEISRKHVSETRSISVSNHLKMETDQVSKTLFSSYLEFWTMD
jgi:hypothetical protein